jgi:isoleucyl-tRNA synthetase
MTGMADIEPKNEIAKREEQILEFWNKNRIFEKSIEKEPTKGEYVFYDGPPFATGTPHYGHLLQSAIKDAIPRYKTMQGHRVKRQWGWDCHGLPIENIVEKELGTKSKKDILDMGVKKFNDLCRERIFTFIGEWERIMPRFGRWADMANPYRTMDFEYMQSEWWAFKTLHEKGLIYEDYRSMHICPRCETTLSQGEVAEGYKDVKDISVTVKFKLKARQTFSGAMGMSEVPENTYLLAWTTTPWTLPGNVALAVNSEISYVMWKHEGANYILSAEAASKYFSDFDISNFERNSSISTLVGLEYEPPFDYYVKDTNLKNRENGWKVYHADFVTADSGTGIAHEAPAFGADDWELAKQVNLPFVQHVNYDGTMKSEVTAFAGMEVKPRSDDDKTRLGTDIAVLKYLQELGTFFSKENITHSYPHCWRCDTPLLNYATSSWFVSVTKIKDRLLETAKDINWSPEHIKEGRWGQWLAGARDWSISRQRFWANTIPVWRCDKCKKDVVFGSAGELEASSGKTVTDLHKDVVDEISFPCECSGAMRRVPDVLDTWFDSGSAPFATRGHGSDAIARGESVVQADFIAEAQDQTRAWFYYMHVLGVALFDTTVFKNCITTGIVLAEDGKKMSKKLKNYPDPVEMIEKYGADAMRFYMLSSPVVRAESLSFSEKGVDEIVKKNLGRLNNVLAFYKLYADTTVRDWNSENVLDRWIMARLDQLIRESTDGYEKYQLDLACRPVSGFIDDLSVWYLRRSRDRFKEDGPDKVAALATMRYVLHRLSLVLAPSMPFYAEYLFQEIRETEDEESVHLASWPEPHATAHFFARLLGEGATNEKLLDAMTAARSVVTAALEAREKAGIKIRQPLSTLFIPETVNLNAELLSIIASEINVKTVTFTKESVIALDTEISETLKEEGFVRELIRAIQSARKDAGLSPHNKIKLLLGGDEAVRVIVEKHISDIKEVVGASEIVLGTLAETTLDVGGRQVSFSIEVSG